jgi:hypothetical protein
VTLGWRTVRAAFGARVEFTGRVTDGDGRPLGGAILDVRSRLRIPGATGRRVGGVAGGHDGRFTYAVTADASRDLTIGDRTLTLLVRAAGTLTATRRGRFVLLAGRLRGGHIPPGGVRIALSTGGRAVSLTRTNAGGVFRARVAAGATQRSFRAVARKDRSWPFVPAQIGASVSA